MLVNLPSSHQSALICGDESISFVDLKALVKKRAGELAAFKGDVVVLTAQNSIAFVATLLGALEKRPVALFSNKWSEAERQERLSKLPNPCILNDDYSARVDYPSASSTTLDAKTRIILFTSGSSGNPKAVALSQSNIDANTAAVIESLRFDEVQVQRLYLPFSYSFGLLGQLVPALQLGVCTYLYNELMEVAHLFHQSEPIGMLSAVPEQWQMLADLSAANPVPSATVTHAVSAGSRLSLPLRERLRDCFPNATLFNNYGMTECSPRVLSLSSRDPHFFSEAVGRPVKGLSVSFDEHGVLKIRGPQVMLGYLGDPVGTAERIQNGEIISGDVGFEQDGIVYLQGRNDDLVKISGERISCQEVADAIGKSPDVAQAYVLAFKDETYGQLLAAFVTVQKPEVTVKDLRRYINANLSASRRPAKIKILSAIPKNANGKVDRKALIQSLEETA